MSPFVKIFSIDYLRATHFYFYSSIFTHSSKRSLQKWDYDSLKLLFENMVDIDFRGFHKIFFNFTVDDDCVCWRDILT